jgi:hypothetical protein
MVVPVFLMEGSNLPFIQEMDEYYNVVDMIPFLNSEYYEMTADIDGSYSIQLNESGLVAFRDLQRDIRIMSLQEIFEYRDRHLADLESAPLLNLQLARACGVPRGAMYGMWTAVAEAYFPEGERSDWVDAEHQLNQRNRAIWSTIEDTGSDDLPLDDTPGDVGFERLFAWLNSNKPHPKWGKIWVKAFLKRPFDERMMELGENWVKSRIAGSSPVIEVKPVLFLFLESTTESDISEDFGPILRDYILEKSEEFYDFYYPNGFLFHLVRNSYIAEEEARDAGKSNYLKYLFAKTESNERLRDELDAALRIKLLQSLRNR